MAWFLEEAWEVGSNSPLAVAAAEPRPRRNWSSERDGQVLVGEALLASPEAAEQEVQVRHLLETGGEVHFRVLAAVAVASSRNPEKEKQEKHRLEAEEIEFNHSSSAPISATLSASTCPT